MVRRNHLRTRAKGLAFPSRDFLRDKNISEKIWRGMKKSVLLHSLNENKGVGKEAIFESNSIKLFVEKYKEDIKP